MFDGASDWVGNQDVYDTSGGIISLWIGHSLVGPFRSDDSPIRRIRRYDTNQLRYVQVSGLRHSAAYRWKPGIGITASSCSAIRRHGMSECRSVSILSAPPGSVEVQPRHTCSRAQIDVSYCYSPMQHDDGDCRGMMMECENLEPCLALTYVLAATVMSV